MPRECLDLVSIIFVCNLSPKRASILYPTKMCMMYSYHNLQSNPQSSLVKTNPPHYFSYTFCSLFNNKVEPCFAYVFPIMQGTPPSCFPLILVNAVPNHFSVVGSSMTVLVSCCPILVCPGTLGTIQFSFRKICFLKQYL